MNNPQTSCGFVAILGAPNVGKSTLLNRIVGVKVSIVSPKVQTTRTRVLGIALKGDAQLIFIDTPGIFHPKRRLERAMVAAAWGGAGDADHVILLVDAQRGLNPDTRAIIDRLKGQDGHTVDLVINKIDLIDKQKLLALTQKLSAEGVFDETYMISAFKGDGVDDLVAHLTAKMPASPWLFPEDQISDMPMRLLAAEITREKLYLKLHQELPYATTVETETWEEKEDGSVRIEQTIYVESESQRSIILGKGGKMIKSIGVESRHDLGEILDTIVHLFLFVKINEKWGDDPGRYSSWGLDFNA
ncbi:MAG: GTPase Era [Rhodospirillales bacterium]|nr:GTPase Era [Rhodospirillales bacterium]|tara:strand:- start:79 stop:984 length:906 start_codon:yes stop_codon:yes gene_type:complete